jgi:EmrB/QacA subfamily drug resistance transporter
MRMGTTDELPRLAADRHPADAAEDRTQTRHAQDRYHWRVLSLVCLAALMTGLNNSSINIALPTIVRHFDASAVQAQWILLSFMLTNTVLMVVFGRVADIVGRREMYLTGVGLFTVMSVVAGFAPSADALIACRVLQAAAGAMLIANSGALVTAAFPRRLLGQGLGLYLASFSLAQLLGPTLGGIITVGLGWQWTFWFNAPLGAACLLWGLRALRRMPRTGEALRLDVAGSVLVLAGLGSLLLAVSEVGPLGWNHPLVLVLLAVFAVAVPTFLVVERRSRNPVVDLDIFRDPVVGLGVLAGLLATMARFAVVLLMGLYFQTIRGETPAAAGLQVLPLAAAAVIASPGAGFLLRYASARTLTVVSNALLAVGLALLLAGISPTTPYPLMLVAFIIIGLGSGSFLPANSTAMLSGVPPHRLGITNAVRTMAQSSGVVLSTAVVLTVISAPLPRAYRESIFHGTLSQVSGTAVDQLVTGYRWALALMILFALLTLAVSLVGRRVNGPVDLNRPLATAEPVASSE